MTHLMTLTERIDADGITMQTLYIGSTRRYVPEGKYKVGKLCPEWVCVLLFPEDSEFFAFDKDRAGAGFVEPNTSRRLITEYGQGVCDDFDNLEPPSVAEVLDALRSDALRMEDADWQLSTWIGEYVAQGVRFRQEVEDEVKSFDEIVTVIRNLKTFLGEEYEDYLHKTESDV